jgi:hypothetical protein
MCSRILASIDIDIDSTAGLRQFQSALLELSLVRHGQVLATAPILSVTSAGVASAIKKPLQHTIDHHSQTSVRKLIELSLPGDTYRVTRKVCGDQHCKFIVKKFRLAFTGSIPGTPCLLPAKKIALQEASTEALVVAEMTCSLAMTAVDLIVSDENLLESEVALYVDAKGSTKRL